MLASPSPLGGRSVGALERAARIGAPAGVRYERPPAADELPSWWAAPAAPPPRRSPRWSVRGSARTWTRPVGRQQREDRWRVRVTCHHPHPGHTERASGRASEHAGQERSPTPFLSHHKITPSVGLLAVSPLEAPTLREGSAAVSKPDVSAIRYCPPALGPAARIEGSPGPTCRALILRPRRRSRDRPRGSPSTAEHLGVVVRP